METTTQTSWSEPECACHCLGELHHQATIAMETGGVDKLARRMSAPALETLCNALRRCVREQCPAHGDAAAEVDELQGIVNECDRLDELHEEQRAQVAAVKAQVAMVGAL